jgi:translation initiation factor 4G
MSKPSTASAQKFSTKSAWAKGPPPKTSSAAGTPCSQFPAPSNATPPTSGNHSRRPSTLGQGIPIKDGISVPQSTVKAAKQGGIRVISTFAAFDSKHFSKGMVVTFGSIDDASSPIPPSPAATSTVKSEGVKAFGSVSARAM